MTPNGQTSMPLQPMERTKVDNLYILLPDGTIKKAEYLDEWANYMEKDHLKMKVIARTKIFGYLISTIFLGLDHSWCDAGPPILFETMIFNHRSKKHDKWQDLYCKRYRTIKEARRGHVKAVLIYLPLMIMRELRESARCWRKRDDA